MAVVKRAPDLGELAMNDNLVYVAVPREMAESFRQWSDPVQFRLGTDHRHPRLRQMTVRPARAK